MKTYPTITRDVQNVAIYAFDKLDGSNIRAEWSRKKGFWKFGSRKRLVGQDETTLGKAQSLILEKYADSLSNIFRGERWQKATAFFEFHGPRSFAGWHHDEDEHTVTLFDVAGDRRGILEPRTFLKLFEGLDHAVLLHTGNANQLFQDAVHHGELPGMTFEGVVCKGPWTSPGLPLMFKVKNHAWIKRLREQCKDDQLFEQLV